MHHCTFSNMTPLLKNNVSLFLSLFFLKKNKNPFFWIFRYNVLFLVFKPIVNCIKFTWSPLSSPHALLLCKVDTFHILLMIEIFIIMLRENPKILMIEKKEQQVNNRFLFYSIFAVETTRESIRFVLFYRCLLIFYYNIIPSMRQGFCGELSFYIYWEWVHIAYTLICIWMYGFLNFLTKGLLW